LEESIFLQFFFSYYQGTRLGLLNSLPVNSFKFLAVYTSLKIKIQAQKEIFCVLFLNVSFNVIAYSGSSIDIGNGKGHLFLRYNVTVNDSVQCRIWGLAFHKNRMAPYCVTAVQWR
jgi:hypothetical protein